MQQTTDLKHVNVPEMHPFEAIDWMTESSEFLHPGGSTANPFKGRAADFYFYETTRGYKFKPAMHAPKREISFTLGNAPATPSYVAQMTTSKTFEHQARSETLHIIQTGMLGSRKEEINCLYSLEEYVKLTKTGLWDKRNMDSYDALVCALYEE